MRPIVYYIATSLDGFIARDDGSFSEFPWDDAYIAGLMAVYPETFPAPFRPEGVTREENKRFDAVLMGRKTYEVGVEAGLANPYPTLDQFVFSTTLQGISEPGVTLVNGDAAGFVADLKRREGGPIWVCGGSNLATSLFDGGLIDEIIVKVNPILLGTGIPLLSQTRRSARLRMKEYRPFESGHMVLSYAVDTDARDG